MRPGADGSHPGLLSGLGKPGTMTDTPFTYPITDFYLTNPIARASETMANCSKTILSPKLAQAAE